MGYFFNKVIGESAPMRALYKVVQKAAQTDATVLLRGESGTGKELFARAVHVNSPAARQALREGRLRVLPGSLIENELFGHEQGAFTGAEARQPGKFEVAEGGTVFIDELGELPLPVQGKLLRVLQDREFERVGGTQTVQVDVRIVAATHRDLAQMVREGKFREDLYYRVKRGGAAACRPCATAGPKTSSGWPATSSPRPRGATTCPPSPASPTARWRGSRPGTGRATCASWRTASRARWCCVKARSSPSTCRSPTSAAPTPSRPPPRSSAGAPVSTLADVERRHVLAVLERARGNRTLAARWLDIGRNTLGRKLKDYGLAEEP